MRGIINMAKLFNFFQREPIILTGQTTEEWVKMCKKKFNINDYKGKYVMHCKTKEEYDDFVKIWSKQDEEKAHLYSTHPSWYNEKENYCLNFNKGTWNCLKYYRKEGYTILEWEDFMSKKEFTKEDLKSGDIVIFRNHEAGVVFLEQNAIIFKRFADYMKLSSYDIKLYNNCSEEWDIVKVHRPVSAYGLIHDQWHKAPVVWEREETVEMTLAEVCKALGKNVKIVKE